MSTQYWNWRLNLFHCNKGILYNILLTVWITESNGWHCTAKTDLIYIKLVPKSVCDNSHQVCCLTKGSIDLIPFNICKLLNPSESEPTNGSILIYRWDMKNFIDEVRLPQSLVKLCEIVCLSIDLLFLLELVGQLLLVVIDFLPDSFLLWHDLLFLDFEVVQFFFLLDFLLFQFLKFLVKLLLLLE